MSLLYGMKRDERLLDAFWESVADTMQGMEAEMKTSIRKQRRNEGRAAGNIQPLGLPFSFDRQDC